MYKNNCIGSPEGTIVQHISQRDLCILRQEVGKKVKDFISVLLGEAVSI